MCCAGAKGGVVCDPPKLSTRELERITKQIDGPATFQSGYVAPGNASTVDSGKNRLGFSFSLSPRIAGTEHASLREMRSVRWMAYAARAFVLRFWGLAKVRRTLGLL